MLHPQQRAQKLRRLREIEQTQKQILSGRSVSYTGPSGGGGAMDTYYLTQNPSRVSCEYLIHTKLLCLYPESAGIITLESRKHFSWVFGIIDPKVSYIDSTLLYFIAGRFVSIILFENLC